jgi:adenosylmethionine-8-amino-7-oxononanoate aminotransferase
MGGTIDGARGDHVLLAPPFIVTDHELDLLIERLRQAIDHAVHSVTVIERNSCLAPRAGPE